MSTAARKLKKEPALREQSTTADSLEQTTPARVPKRGESGGPNDDNSLATSSSDHPNEADDCARIVEVLGTTDPAFGKGIYAQVGLLFSLATIKGKKPKDQFQAMLVVQAALTHLLAIKQASQLARADNLAMQDSAERAYNKLARTFIMQLETLNRLETGGEQKVTVQNVSVNEGGQAIVGNVMQGAREQPMEKTPALTDARQEAMPIISEPAFSPIPVKSGGNNDEPSST